MEFRTVVLLSVLFGFFAVASSLPCCGDGRCEYPVESCRSCPRDCGPCPSCGLCGNRVCDSARGETSCNCPLDCGPCCVDGVCREDRNETYLNCPQDCAFNLQVQTVDADTRVPLPAALVRCSTMAVTFPTQTTPSPSATVTYLSVGGDSYVCTGELYGYLPGSISFNYYPLSDRRVQILPLKKNPACLSGTVYDAVTLETLDEASVYCAQGTLERTTTRITGINGQFYYEPVSPGSWRCFGSRATYFPGSNDGVVEPGQMATIDIYLNPLPGSIIGTVYNLVNNQIIPGATVVCTTSANVVLPQRTTVATVPGYYISEVTAGPVTCTASLFGFTTDTRRGVVVRGQNVTIDFFIGELPGLLIVTTVEEGAPSILVPTARVDCLGASLSFYTGITNLNATYTFQGVAPSTYTCTGSGAVGYGTGRTTGIVVVRNATTNAIVPLPPLPGTIIVQVVDAETGALLPGGPVTLLPLNMNANTTSAATYTFTGLKYGTYGASASYFGYTSNTINGRELRRGETLTIVVPLSPLPGTLIVSVFATDTNALIAGASVSVTGQTAFQETLTTGSKSYSVPAGNYNGFASATGYSSNSNSTVVFRSQTSNLIIYLSPLPNMITVEVRDITDNSLVQNSFIAITGFTAVGGPRNSFMNVPAGTYFAFASATGYDDNNTAVIPANIVRNTTGFALIYLRPRPCIINVQVLDVSTNAPIPDATVILYNSAGVRAFTATSNAFGFSNFTSVFSAVDIASASKFSYVQVANATIGCTRGSVRNVTIYLREVIQIALTLLDADTDGPASFDFYDVETNITGTTRLLTDNELDPVSVVQQRKNVFLFSTQSLPIRATFRIIGFGYQDFGPIDLTFTNTNRNRSLSLTIRAYTVYIIPYEVMEDTSINELVPYTPDDPSGFIAPDPLLPPFISGFSNSSNRVGQRLSVTGSSVDLIDNSDFTVTGSSNFQNIQIDQVVKAGLVPAFPFAPETQQFTWTYDENGTQANAYAQSNPLPWVNFTRGVYNNGAGWKARSNDATRYQGEIFAAVFENVVPSSRSAFYIRPKMSGYGVNLNLTRPNTNTWASTNNYISLRIPDYFSVLDRTLFFYLPCKLNLLHVVVYTLPFKNGVQLARYPSAISVPLSVNFQTDARTDTSSTPGPVRGFAYTAHQFTVVLGSTIRSIVVTAQEPPFSRATSNWVNVANPSSLTILPPGTPLFSAPFVFNAAWIANPTVNGGYSYGNYYLNNGNPTPPTQQVFRITTKNVVYFVFGLNVLDNIAAD